MNDTQFAFIHVEKTAGWSIRQASHRCRRIFYHGHRPITEQIDRDYTTVSVLRNPVDRYISWIKWVYRFRDFKDDKNLLMERCINNIESHRTYQDYYFKEYKPDIMLSFDNIQADWSQFVYDYQLCDVDTVLPWRHQSNTRIPELTKSQRCMLTKILSKI